MAVPRPLTSLKEIKVSGEINMCCEEARMSFVGHEGTIAPPHRMAEAKLKNGHSRNIAAQGKAD
jgi:hypothetical protein